MEGYIMDALWGLVGSMIGVIGTISISALSDRKAYRKIEGMIGKLDNTTLSGQHSEIRRLLNDKNSEVRSLLNDKHIETVESIKEHGRKAEQDTRDLNSKMDSIKAVIDKNEVRYENLNLDQKEIRDNVMRMVQNYELLIQENKTLREENHNLKEMLAPLLKMQQEEEQKKVHRNEPER